MTIAPPAGTLNTNVSPQNYGGVPPKQEQVGFNEALNRFSTSSDASNTQSSKGTDQSQGTSNSYQLPLATRPPINLGNPTGKQGVVLYDGNGSKAGSETKAPSLASTAPTAAPTAAPAATTQTVPGTSTPLPKDAVIDQKTKVATLQSGDFTVKVMPDRKAHKGEKVNPEGAETKFNIPGGNVHPKIENGKVTGVTINKEINIQTVYSPKADPAADSAYGRGAIKSDKDAGNSSLRFHEGSHGQDYIDYVKTHPYPTIKIDQPITVQEYNKRVSEFNKQTKQYAEDMSAYSEKHTDNATDPPAATTSAAAK
jgi:hypothetical protein